MLRAAVKGVVANKLRLTLTGLAIVFGVAFVPDESIAVRAASALRRDHLVGPALDAPHVFGEALARRIYLQIVERRVE